MMLPEEEQDFFKRAHHLEQHGLYDPSDEHDACGVGLIASIDGTARRDVVEKGIEALKSVWHRGALNADGKTGDGAGIHLAVPDAFFAHEVASYARAKAAGSLLGVGQLFLPRTNAEAQEQARLIIETQIVHKGYEVVGWRQVPVCAEVIGEDANKFRPEIMQIFIKAPHGMQRDDFEVQLYIIRRTIEQEMRARAITECYICSFSCKSIIYKGLFQASQLAEFYPELKNPLIISPYVMFHQRFSTNTAPSWQMAQPFRVVAHNGEINTLRGNLNWMSSYEVCFGAERFAQHMSALTPIVAPRSSDTAALDAVIEFVTQAGMDLPFAKLMMMPPAWSDRIDMPDAQRALYEYCNCLMSPWDGPAAIVATDGSWVLAGTDRNGLRPLRYAITTEGLLTIGSETGMVPIEDHDVIERGQLAPGQMLGVQLDEGILYRDSDIKEKIAHAHDYRKKLATLTYLKNVPQIPFTPHIITADALKHHHYNAAITQEDIDLIIMPMMLEGKEAVGSMGDDTPLAVLSSKHRPLHHYFRQHFSQVTNPPIDPLREQHTMSLDTRVGMIRDILSETPDLSQTYHLDSPIMFGAAYQTLVDLIGTHAQILDSTYPAEEDEDALRRAIDDLLARADAAICEGAHTIILDDEGISAQRMAIPAILAAGAVHTHMVRQSKRKQLSIIMRTSTVVDTHSVAVMLGVGATAIYPYALEQTAYHMEQAGRLQGITAHAACENIQHALDQGLLKIMSKMGISVLSSYRGGRNFDAIGLSRSLVAEFFPGLVSRISGITLKQLHHKAWDLHQEAWSIHNDRLRLPVGGLYRYRNNGEHHAYEGTLIHRLQTACTTGSYRLYKEVAEGFNSQQETHVRSLLEFQSDRAPIALHEVESVHRIRTRFVAPAMSLGALSPEAHETLAIAMNRIGAQSNSGEGGEGAERYYPYANGDNANSGIKQVASGRFGVTTEYLNHCSEIQIKIAQGAKPGEGGQLPAFKVTAEIARLRHATEGVSLISPPPHHDIYSIEDLAQLIYDLKQVNPEAIVSVKLVSQSGIGTIASGVVKALADKIIISGHVGGTGASPLTSIKYAGAPWEIGLAEVTQVLSLNKLRHRVTLQTDGGLKTGRDIVIAAMLGAEEYALGTLSLVAMGCLLVRQCHSNTCPVGICTQKPELRKHFDGSPEKVINLMTFIADDVREILASLGYRHLDEVIGRTDLLRQVPHESAYVNMVDLIPLLTQPVQHNEAPRTKTIEGRNAVARSLDEDMLEELMPRLASGQKVQLHYRVNNTHRNIGTRISGTLVREKIAPTLQEEHIHIVLSGSAGQSLGAFAVRGVKLEMLGDANDYVGKGLSGGMIIVRPAPSSTLETQHNAIIGNTVLYGATSGMLFAAGRAGERFAVRNSGAHAVIEGCGTNGCEYMTGGIAVILGEIGHNFGAGMTGGMAFIYDPHARALSRLNHESIVHQRIQSPYWEGQLKALIERHVKETHSLYAKNLLNEWEFTVQDMWHICPKELLHRLAHPIIEVQAA